MVKITKLGKKSMTMEKNNASHCKPVMYNSISWHFCQAIYGGFMVAFFFFFLSSVQALSSQIDKILSLLYSCHLCIRFRSLQRQPQGPCIVALCSQS